MTPTNATVQMRVTVQIPFPETRTGEAFADDLAFESVRQSLSKSLDPISRSATVERLEPEHAEQFHPDFGMQYDCGMPLRCRVYPDGTWKYPADGPDEKHGLCLQDLIDFVRASGGNPAKRTY